MHKKDKNNLGEFRKLPADHPNTIPHHPCFEYDCYYDYLDTFSEYHFDKSINDKESEDINTRLKFRGKCIDNVMDEVLPFQREQSKNIFRNDVKASSVASWYLEQEIGTMEHVGYKQTVDPERHPTLQKIVDWFEFEDDQSPIILEKNIGDYQQWHVDCHAPTNMIRVLIHLQDWEFGQALLWGTKSIVQWHAGDAIMWNPHVPHATFNAGRHKRYTLRVTGTPSARTLEKLKAGGTINVDKL